MNQILNQVEIYDQVWHVRHTPENGKHSEEAVILVKEILEKLKNIPDGCAECFPFRKNISDSQDYSEAGMRQFSPGC